MALALESAGLVRQKVYNALMGGTGGIGRDALRRRLWWTAAREFFLQHADAGNADLQYVAFSEADADAAGGTDVAGIDAACQIYMFYVKKLASATANTVKLYDDTTDDATAANQTLSIPLDESNQEAMIIYPTGFSHSNGVVVTQHTTIEGTTDGSDGGDGFYVVGA